MNTRIGRREFITLLGGAGAAWPIAAPAEQPGKQRIIGFLGAATPMVTSPWTAAFVERLREVGWIEGRTIATSTAGRKDATSNSVRSRQSSPGLRSM